MKREIYRYWFIWTAVSILLVAGFALYLGARVKAQDAVIIAGGDPAEPQINGPRIVGGTPGKPFLFLIPATGDGPLSFKVDNLPPGLALDPQSGIISGSLKADGTYVTKVAVTGKKGTASRNLVIVVGKDKLALTPPMGWNSWNVWGTAVSDEKVRAAADAMIASGLAAHGFQYVNIDDGWQQGKEKLTNTMNLALFAGVITQHWQKGRAASGEILPNENFPDMKGLGDYVHSRGLRLGIYSSPGPKTCAMYEGSLGHEQQDAQSYAKWGVDYLKYDLCSYGLDKLAVTRQSYIKPYKKMGDYLAATDRDIVYSLCEYGQHKVWEWGDEVGGNLWRTTGDVQDVWKGNKVFPIGISFSFEKSFLAPYAGPGHWNDPDMLVVGKVGWGPTQHDSRLTQDEQITHITLWSMAAAPLLIGCKMTEMDKFTHDLLTNHDVIEVDQDPLGRAATQKASFGKTEVWARPLWDGTLAVALYNKGEEATEVKAQWSDLGLSGAQPVRDLWLHKDLGNSDGSFTAKVRPHGAVLIKVGKPQKEDFDPTK